MNKSSFSVVLINPRLSVEHIYGKYSDLGTFQPPIGLCSLASYLIHHGYSVRLIDACVLNMSNSSVLDDLKSNPGDLVGIYTNTANYHVVVDLVRRIKSINPRQKVVLGGPHVTFLPEDSLKKSGADYCVIGEGEETLLELVEHIHGGESDLSSVNGIAYKSEGGQVVITANRTMIDDLDRLPFPAIHLLPPVTKYKLYLLQYKKLPYMTVLSSRGCPYRCVFCKTPFGRKARYHSPEYVVDYIEYLSKNFGVKEISFVDDTFPLDVSRVGGICEGILNKGLDVSWYANARVDSKDDGIFKVMQRAGCWIVAVGAESGDSDVLKLMKKNVTPEQILHTCRLIRKTGLKLKVFFILGSPGETLDTIERTVQFAKSLQAHYPQFTLMTPFPGSELWDTAEQYGTFDRTDLSKLIISSSDPAFVPFGLTKKELLDKQKEAFRRVYCTPSMVMRQILSIDSFSEIGKKIKAFFAFIKVQTN